MKLTVCLALVLPVCTQNFIGQNFKEPTNVEKRNNCTFWLPNPDKLGSELKTQGIYRPNVAKTTRRRSAARASSLQRSKYRSATTNAVGGQPASCKKSGNRKISRETMARTDTAAARAKEMNRNRARSIRAEMEATAEGREFSKIGYPVLMRDGKVLKGDAEGIHWMKPMTWKQLTEGRS